MNGQNGPSIFASLILLERHALTTMRRVAEVASVVTMPIGDRVLLHPRGPPRIRGRLLHLAYRRMNLTAQSLVTIFQKQSIMWLDQPIPALLTIHAPGPQAKEGKSSSTLAGTGKPVSPWAVGNLPIFLG